MYQKKFILPAIIILFVSLLWFGNTNYASAQEADNTICKGVFIDTVDVSGMTRKQAQEAVDNFIKGLQEKGIAITVGDDVVYAKVGDLDYTYEPNDDIDQALSLGTAGNLIKRYKDLKDIEQGKVVFPLSFKINEEKLEKLVKKKAGAYNIKPVNAKFAKKDGAFVFTDEVVGSKVNVDQTAEAIKNVLLNNWSRTDIVVNGVMEDDLPKYSRKDLEQCTALLGSYSTVYTDSAEGRAANLANGARLINNTLLYPGDEFSGYEHLNPFTESNGYYVAGAYLDGKVIDSVGGGACQVTTTLYNAVLFAELEVVQRQPHSMIIGYVDLSRDAAIAGTYKDLKFKNNTKSPVLIEAYTVGRKITFNIWGHETRATDNRTIEYVTKVISKTDPPKDVITKDPTQPTTYRRVTQSAHVGYRAELYKVVYENGKEVSRTLVNKSSYNAAPAYVTVGTKEVKKEDDKPKPTDKPKAPSKPKTNTDKPKSGEDETAADNNDIEDQSLNQNRSNPEDQVQGDFYWDQDILD